MTDHDEHAMATSHTGVHADHADHHGGEHGVHDTSVHHDSHADHGGHAGHGADHVAQFRKLFWINLIIAVPVIAFSTMFAMLLGYAVPAGSRHCWARSCTLSAVDPSSPARSAKSVPAPRE